MNIFVLFFLHVYQSIVVTIILSVCYSIYMCNADAGSFSISMKFKVFGNLTFFKFLCIFLDLVYLVFLSFLFSQAKSKNHSLSVCSNL